MEIIEKYPQLRKPLELIFEDRRNEILNYMLENDEEYKKLTTKRSKASEKVKSTLKTEKEFEKYSNAVYAHEIYEIDAVYKQAVFDTLDMLKNLKLL